MQGKKEGCKVKRLKLEKKEGIPKEKGGCEFKRLKLEEKGLNREEKRLNREEKGGM